MPHPFLKEKLSRRSMCFVLSFSCPTLHSAVAEGRHGGRFHTSEEEHGKRA